MKKLFAVLCILTLCIAGFAAAETPETAGGQLRIENGMMQPMLNWSDMRAENYTNEGSDILRFCVWVETDYDTDFDGFADLVKVLVQMPRAAAEGKFKAAVIYDPTPYSAGTNERGYIPAKVPFRYEDFYHDCEKRESYGTMTALEAAEQADPSQWNYSVPVSGQQGYAYAQDYDYFLVRGFAVVSACGIGTYGSEGFELCGTHLERDSHKCVVEWLTGDRRAFTDRFSLMEIPADWCNGCIAMTGCSYGGTIPFEVAVTGVKGLKTIIPMAGIASWYNYTNSQGVSLLNESNYADYLSANNAGATYLDPEWQIQDRRYCSWLYQIAKDQEDANGDWAEVWEEMDYTKPEENHAACSALIVAGMNDYNVTTVHADMMYRTFEQAGQTVKMILHQDGHNTLYRRSINGQPWEEMMNKWLSHYLYGVENDVEEWPAVLAQSNIDGTFNGYDSWGDLPLQAAEAEPTEEPRRITSYGLAAYTDLEKIDPTQGGLMVENRELFYREMYGPMRAVYTLQVPENATLYGTPEVHVKLACDQTDLDGLMITAILMDVTDNGEPFMAYRISGEYNLVNFDSDGEVLVNGGGMLNQPVFQLIQDTTAAQLVSIGWTDLQNPGMGPDASDYVLQSPGLEAGVYKDYTFYMLPTVYTVAEGHHLELYLMTWDPYRVFLDEQFLLDPNQESELADYNYSFDIDESSLQVLLSWAD